MTPVPTQILPRFAPTPKFGTFADSDITANFETTEVRTPPEFAICAICGETEITDRMDEYGGELVCAGHLDELAGYDDCFGEQGMFDYEEMMARR